jgi:hypothetical protein
VAGEAGCRKAPTVRAIDRRGPVKLAVRLMPRLLWRWKSEWSRNRQADYGLEWGCFSSTPVPPMVARNDRKRASRSTGKGEGQGRVANAHRAWGRNLSLGNRADLREKPRRASRAPVRDPGHGSGRCSEARDSLRDALGQPIQWMARYAVCNAGQGAAESVSHPGPWGGTKAWGPSVSRACPERVPSGSRVWAQQQPRSQFPDEGTFGRYGRSRDTSAAMRRAMMREESSNEERSIPREMARIRRSQ